MKNKKLLLIVLALMLVCVISVMGTLAYLTAQSNNVTNTFVAAGIGTMKLDESKANATSPGVYTLDKTTRVTSNNYTVIPGTELPKDPVVTIETLDVEAYLFVSVDDLIFSGSSGKEMTWAMDDNWTLVGTEWNGNPVYVWNSTVKPSDVTGATATNPTNVFNIIKDQKLVVENFYGTDWSQSSTPEATRMPGYNDRLNFTAYMCQAAGFANAAEAGEACFYFTPVNP